MSFQTYIRPYAKLVRAGRDFICACPFHETSANAMRIFPSADYFECSECGRRGNSRDLRHCFPKIRRPGDYAFTYYF